MSTLRIRSAKPADLPAVEAIENRCFSASRRSSLRALKHSLHSPVQSVWVAVGRIDGQRQIAGVMILYHHRLSVRIFSLAVLPAFRGSGVGRRLVQRAVALSRKTGRTSVTLEADRRNKVLTAWYEQFGFETYRILKDYYSPGRHAVRMRLILPKGRSRGCSQLDHSE
ncbi:MAG: GNAT family N-acetyltransferase [Verrucomicrobia bacterium]|nr:GNAT family N-acetyltransferase [Verrucomicrobiota bacterium]